MDPFARRYGYRDDPAVPELPEGEFFVVIDGECALCSKGAAWIARHDRGEAFGIIPVQSAPGKALLRHYGLDPASPESWLFLDHGNAHTSLAAILRMTRHFGGFWLLLAPLTLLPRAVQDWLYQRVARNRYQWFGRADICAMPDPEVRKRLIQ